MLCELEFTQAPVWTLLTKRPTSWQEFVALACHLAEVILPSEGVSQPHLKQLPIPVTRQLSGQELVTVHFNGVESTASASIKLIMELYLLNSSPPLFFVQTPSMSCLF